MSRGPDTGLPARALAWAATTVVLALSLMRVDTPPEVDAFNLDKLVHAAMYGTLMALHARTRPRALWGRVALALAAYGAVIEVLQGLTPYRSASLLDALANAAGISIMLWVLALRARQARDGRHDPLQTGPHP